MYFGLLCVAVLAASTNAFSIHSGNVEKKLRLLNPSFMMIEELFNLLDETQCIEKLFCLMETEMYGVTNNPLKHYSRFLTNLYHEIEPMAFGKVKGLVAKYPHISKVLDAIADGQHGDSHTCNTKYEECPNDQSELVSFAKMLGDDVMSQQLPTFLAKSKRADVCQGSKIGCSLIAGGCAICAAATEGVCGLLCGATVAATCTGVGIGCKGK